jgi:hypothetical protein
MPRSRKPAAPEDQLDAALDGPLGPVAAELGPLLEAAEGLRSSLSRLQLDPAVAERHLAQVLGAAAAGAVPAIAEAVPIRAAGGDGAEARGAVRPTRRARARRDAARQGAWRRRAVAFGLAAAAVVAPLVALSARTLPGEPLYPVKLTVENARLTAARSPGQRAELRTQYAGTRLHELDSLVDGGRTDRIPSAISALDSALAAAQRSVGATSGQRSTALDGRLRGLRAGQTAELTSLVKRLPSTTPTAARVKIEGAVQRSLAGDR